MTDKKSFDEVEGILRSSFNTIRNDPTKLIDMLVFKSKFYNVSLNNSLLIYNQNPNATFVCDPETWNKATMYQDELQIHDGMKLTKGIKVFYPLDKEFSKLEAETVYDVSQIDSSGSAKRQLFTHGKFHHEYAFDGYFEEDPQLCDWGYFSYQHPVLYKAIKNYAHKKGLIIEETKLPPDLQSSFNSFDNIIQINERLNDTEKLSALTNELVQISLSKNKSASPEPVQQFKCNAASIILKSYFGVPLSENDKKDFLENYNSCCGLKSFKLENALVSVNVIYRKLHDDIQPALSPAKRLRNLQFGLKKKQLSVINNAVKQAKNVSRKTGDEYIDNYINSHFEDSAKYLTNYPDHIIKSYQMLSAEDINNVPFYGIVVYQPSKEKLFFNDVKKFNKVIDEDQDECPLDAYCLTESGFKKEIEQEITSGYEPFYSKKILKRYKRLPNILKTNAEFKFVLCNFVVEREELNYCKANLKKGKDKEKWSHETILAEKSFKQDEHKYRELKYKLLHANKTATIEQQPLVPIGKNDFILPQKVEGKYSRMYAYLTKTRCIDPEIVRQCIKDNLLYEDKNHNTVFVGKDGGKAEFATRHSTLTGSSFKRDVAGSRQDIGFMVDNNANKLYVCEAPIDALSIMSLMKQQGKQVEKASYLATCGTGKDVTVYTRLKENPQIKEVVLANDHDAAGSKANKKIYEHLCKDFPDIKVKILSAENGKSINNCLHHTAKPVKKVKEFESEVER